jgi:heterodisulfide reductase subunit A
VLTAERVGTANGGAAIGEQSSTANEPDARQEVSNNDDKVGAVLVVGGGIAGMQSSLDLANSGFKVYLLDTSPAIGGVMAQLDKTFPTNDCSMCIMAPKLVDVGRHPNIELVTYSDLVGLEGGPGNFTVRINKKARYVDPEKCTGCGVCAKECPIDAISDFNERLSKRRAIFLRYPQAVPLAYTIDRDKCIGCGLCESLCLADAIRYDDADIEETINVGSIILCPGFSEFEAQIKDEYGHGRYKNVVTSIEFERILSASGPFKGHVQRPSDGDMPRKVAWIQCVGSRDRACGNNYCSSVCCTYAIKEAVIAKEHVSKVEPTIFFMDMRTHGKGFEEYYNRAKDEYGVRFIRCRIPEVREIPDTKNLIIRYETEGSDFVEEEFDMVVLSVGLEPGKGIKELAERLGIGLNQYGFCMTDPLAPIDTTREGVYACGAFSGPKDIPETVVEASGAASRASSQIASERFSLIEKDTYPEETDVSEQPTRIGVFVCNCGINIGGYVDVPEVREYAKTLPNVAYAEDNLYTCSQDTQKKIVEKVKEHDLNRVIVASCTPRTHEPLFQETIRRAGLNPYLFEMANIRDQCSWVHMNEPEKATEKAKELVRMAVAKAALRTPLPTVSLDVTQKALIIGGGLAGMTSALAIAQQGYEVFLVERDTELGGNLRNLHYDLDNVDLQAYLADMITKVEAQALIRVFKGAEIGSIEGYVGNYKTQINTGSSVEEVEHGVVIIATGAREFQPSEYLYGEDERVVTQLQFERMVAEDEDLAAKTVTMIQCVGSRDEEHPWCSRVCCTDAIKNSIRVKERHPDANVFVLYRDMRTYGFRETYYEKARELGVIFVRYDLESKPTVRKGQDTLEVMTRDKILDEDLTISTDVLVLSTAIVPREGNEELARQLKVPLNEHGFFLEAHVKLRPVDFATEGVFLAGMAHSPMAVNETIAQAYAAASRACTIISADTFVTEATIASVNDNICIGCGLCVEACPYSAIELVDGKAKVKEALCKGCGLCNATCRGGAIQQNGFNDHQIISMIRSALYPTA